jgi:predicted 3-demethylubiquinone-9 3-methyltransferase (glyoxalase superfamily)
VQKITTFLTFDDQAEEAMTLYTSIFKSSRVVSRMRDRTGRSPPANSSSKASASSR